MITGGDASKLERMPDPARSRSNANVCADGFQPWGVAQASGGFLA